MKVAEGKYRDIPEEDFFLSLQMIDDRNLLSDRSMSLNVLEKATVGWFKSNHSKKSDEESLQRKLMLKDPIRQKRMREQTSCKS